MQRQSLGSPGRGATTKDDTVLKPDDTKRRESSPATSISVAVTDTDEIKPEKPNRCQIQPEKSIHLIPLLIIFCFFILYLSSHDPSPQDLANFTGFKPSKILTDLEDIDEIGGVNDRFERGKVLAIRSMRNLQEEIEEEAPKSRNHRKFGDF